MRDKVRVGITIGDINGIGPEVIIKALNNDHVTAHCVPVIYGSSKVVSYHKNVVKKDEFSFTSVQSAERLNYNKVNVLNCWDETVNISLGMPTEEGGKCAHIALDRATRDLKEGLIDVLVTAPINKEAMQKASFQAPGHTEYLAKELGGEVLMIMVSEAFKVGLVTAHIPISEVAQNITKDNVINAMNRFIETLRIDFGIERPSIAVLGLNPHASDNGLMGTEEREVLKPVILEFKKAGHIVMGPYSSDGFFGSGLYKKFDGVMAMYHDQALIPFKSLSFGEGVNYTAGLPYIRTSPDHGTGYDIVGTNQANESSFRKALFLAIDLFRERTEYEEAMKNRLQKTEVKKGKSGKRPPKSGGKKEAPEQDNADSNEAPGNEGEALSSEQ